MRFSRGCYDKYHRCPGWAGGGMKFAKVPRCDGGYVHVDFDDPRWRWKFQRCERCGVIVWPYNTRWLDPTWWPSEVRWWGHRVQWWWEDRSR